MKKYLTMALLLILSEPMFAQDYQISFTGSGSSSTIDSIEVLNLTQQTSLTLSGTDILHLLGTVGLFEETINDERLKVYPNPMNLSARIEFENPGSGLTTITITDITGKTLLKYDKPLVKGYQVFTISGLLTGLYLIEISNDEANYTTSMISAGNNNLPYLRYEGSIPIGEKENQLKSLRNLVQMQYNDGDILLLKGISFNYERIITLVPTESQQLEFEFIECNDFDNNFYPIVTIGTQTWMAENLKVSHYSNGDEIPNVTDNSQWHVLTSGAYCLYNNDISWRNAYGALYNWYAVVDERELCPSGWHIPTTTEWTILADYLGGESLSGGIMKSTITEPNEHPRWDIPNTDATNERGFSGLPCGIRDNTGQYLFIGSYGTFWSSSDAGSGAWFCALFYNSGIVDIYIHNKKSGGAVRCLKD